MPEFYNRIKKDLQQRQNDALYRQRRIAESAQAPEMVIDGRKVLNFCSNDYLGLANHPDVKQAFCAGIQQWGAGTGAAHLVNGHTQAHHALEEELADFLGYPRVLLFSTGYMANLGALSALLQKGDSVIEDKLNHASLLDAARLSGATLTRYLHSDGDNLQTKLQKQAGNVTLVATDGVFSMDGDLAPLANISQISKQQNAVLMVDDAHGIGVLGEEGRGTLSYTNLAADDVPILVGTFGKAFGTSGAFVAADNEVIETLIQKARTYIYTTAAPAAIAEATRASLKIIRQDQSRRERLHANIQQLRQGLSALDLTLGSSPTAIQPVIVGDAAQALQLSQSLFELGILITAIRPPTVPSGTARLRITLSSQHTETQIQILLQKLEKALACK